MSSPSSGQPVPADVVAEVNEEEEEEEALASFDSSTVIVIHPGSLNLRIGRASDPLPHTIPQVIARKNKSKNNLIACQEDPYLIPAVKLDKDATKQLQETQYAVAAMLAAGATDCGHQRIITPKERISEHNKKVKPSVVPKGTAATRNWSLVDSKPDAIIGEDVLLLKPTEPYHIRWPMRRGQLNIHRGIAGSVTSAITDLQSIWSYAIKEILQIPLNELNRFKVVLIIPDVYNRNHVKELISLLLRNLGFSSCFVQHEAICATFGAGLSCATVVDVGDQKTSVCCVEDGFSPRCARLTLDYGGSDITQLFHYLLKQRSFPYSECKSESRIGGMLLQSLKENFCHMDMTVSGTREKQFQVSIPDQPLLQYNVLLGDESIYAPLALFAPELFLVTGTNKKLRILSRNEGDSDDPFDENYLIQTKRKYGEANDQTQLAPGSGDLAPAAGDDNDDPLDDQAPNSLIINEKEILTNRLMGIDQAIIQCVERCDNEDATKRRMISVILVVGGGLGSFSGANLWLQHKLSALVASHYPGEQPHIEVITRPKDMDGKLVTWKGAAVMSLLDTANELWISRSDWDKAGVRVLREKSSFIW